ncbi:MAG: DUF1801 domain-containing protein [Bacteroidetes bacterium]|nr:DUF1801 domain-containing protein [Bacteroidota bacterium]
MTNKTVPQKKSVDEFISLHTEDRQEQCKILMDLMHKITGEEAVMWGPSIIGYGKYHYKYESGREGDFFLAGFSPRKTNLTVYVMSGFGEQSVMDRLGKYKTGKGCLYIKNTNDINLEVLEELLRYSVQKTKEKYPD